MTWLSIAALKLLAKVPDAAIDAAPYEANCEVVRRLEAELARYKSHTEEEEGADESST